MEISSKELFVNNPDLSEVSELMLKIWPRPCWEYTPELLGFYIDKPTGDSSLSLGLYYNDKLAGYLVFIPYMVQYHGKQFPVVCPTWWTASRDLPIKNKGLKLYRELFRLSREKGYAGLIGISHNNTIQDSINRRTWARLREPFRLINTFVQIMTLPQIIRRRLHGAVVPSVRHYDSDMGEGCKELLDKMPAVDLAMTFSSEDIDYFFQNSTLTRTWLYCEGKRVRGLVNVVRKTFLGEHETVNAYMNHVVLSELSIEERNNFLYSIFQDQYWDDIYAICIPSTGFINQRFLTEIGFRNTMKKYNLYYIPFDSRLDIDKVNTFYFEGF